jgi:hypothetical protein
MLHQLLRRLALFSFCVVSPATFEPKLQLQLRNFSSLSLLQTRPYNEQLASKHLSGFRYFSTSRKDEDDEGTDIFARFTTLDKGLTVLVGPRLYFRVPTMVIFDFTNFYRWRSFRRGEDTPTPYIPFSRHVQGKWRGASFFCITFPSYIPPNLYVERGLYLLTDWLIYELEKPMEYRVDFCNELLVFFSFQTYTTNVLHVSEVSLVDTNTPVPKAHSVFIDIQYSSIPGFHKPFLY